MTAAWDLLVREFLTTSGRPSLDGKQQVSRAQGSLVGHGWNEDGKTLYYSTATGAGATVWAADISTSAGLRAEPPRTFLNLPACLTGGTVTRAP